MEWLGEVPEHWDTAPLKTVTTHNDDVLDERTPAETEIVYVDISSVDVIEGIKSKDVMMFSNAPSRARRRVRHGDVIVSTVRTYLRAIARIRDPEANLVVSTGFAVIRPRSELLPDFLGYVLSASYFVEQVIARSTGVSYPAINASELVAIPIFVPPRVEQALIASLLDRETARIDALVDEQQRLVELLKEKREAVISHAVTKGLNPDAPIKPSGVEWLGELPSHWRIAKMKWVARMESGHTPDKKIAAYWENCDIPWVSLNDTAYLKDNDYISQTAYQVNDLGIANSSARVLPARVVVFSRDATIGRCAITTCPMAVSQHFIAWVCGDAIMPEYLLLRLRSMTQELDRLTAGATLKTIGMPDVKTLVTPVPPLAEQKEIVACVADKTARLDDLISEAHRAIALLQERRTALISAAVTGKIDVRTMAA